jgi:hypothetical protein
VVTAPEVRKINEQLSGRSSEEALREKKSDIQPGGDQAPSASSLRQGLLIEYANKKAMNTADTAKRR